MADRNPKVMNREFLAERDLQMFKQRQAGRSTMEIAKRFGVTTSVVNKAIQRQLEKLNREALLAYPEVLRMELERLDTLQAQIWPLTQHRKVKLDDGSEIMVEPDLKAIQQVLAIMDRRSKLLGMEQNNVSIQMDVNSTQEIKASLAGATEAISLSTFNPEQEARSLLEIMGRTGVIPQDVVNEILGENKMPLPAAIEAPVELVSGMEADDNEH
jgi:hypothetical protein